MPAISIVRTRRSLFGQFDAKQPHPASTFIGSEQIGDPSPQESFPTGIVNSDQELRA